MARTGVHGTDVPVGACASAHPILQPDGRVAPIFQAEGEEKESGQEGEAEGTEEDGEEKESNEEETAAVISITGSSAGASR
ncbi:MAG TPA: hypothetical protein VG454_07125 [Gemmatimonadales bacterium]|nr:hypothetical protein [Gemmatimonadales bacterium]